jgi:hypothetical protein
MADPEESDPLNSEAESQSEETIMPWLWGGVGVLVVAAFIAWMIFGAHLGQPRNPPAATPLAKPAAQHY